MPASPISSAPSRRVVAATVAGNALEFYDFVTYAFFAVFIGRTFFPVDSPLASLLLSVAVFGVGFVTRPLGGLLIGAYADRAGRKPAMLLTIALITTGTLGLAVTPSYAQIGMAAPIIIVLCRLIQGLALGGEVGPASAFLIEIAPLQRRGMYAAWQSGSQGAATLVAGLLGVWVSSALSPEQLDSWGWRLPFALGLLLLPLAFYLRRAMPETLEAHAAPAPRGTLARHRGHLLRATLIILGGTVATYVQTYMTSYAITTLNMPATTSMWATVIGGFGTLVFALLGGWLSDRYGRRPLMLLPRLALALLIYPAFMWLVAAPDLWRMFVVVLLLSALNGMAAAVSLVAIPELLPARVRAIGLSLVYAVGVTLFGGTTQFVITWLIGTTGEPTAPAAYVVLTSLISALAVWLTPESRGHDADARA